MKIPTIFRRELVVIFATHSSSVRRDISGIAFVSLLFAPVGTNSECLLIMSRVRRVTTGHLKIARLEVVRNLPSIISRLKAWLVLYV
jgi:hypothetical protein